MWFQWTLLALVGLAAGMMVAGGMFAFVTMIGVVQRMAARSKTAKFVHLYENLVIIGGTLGNLYFIFEWKVPLGVWMLAVYGLFAGVYVGCLSFALEEVLNVFPIFSKRMKLTKGISFIILMFALGKCFGALYQFL